jgi:predicted TIM-barrel fold metal-dependent hydrolase
MTHTAAGALVSAPARRFLGSATTIGVAVLVVWTAGAIALRCAGGASDLEPSALASSLSPGAQRLLDASFEDVVPRTLLDHHVHVLGLGTNGTGTWIHPKMLSWSHPFSRVKALVYLSGAQVSDPSRADEQYVARLVDLARNASAGRLLLLGFDYRYDPEGNRDPAGSEFHTPNRYVVNLAATHPDLFIPAVSVHPHRADAVEALHSWANRGVRFVKWLPNAMGIDASREAHDEYYRALIERNMVLLTHVGEEQAVESEEDQKLGNPLLFRRPLDMGVTVVMAHAASLGSNEDLDHPGETLSSFELFLRLMDEARYEGHLYGEISATTQVNRLPDSLAVLLGRTDLHHRLINGSDYPLPAINVVIQTRALVRHGMLTAEEREWLNEIYDYNPLLFDYAVKRTIRHPESGDRFPASVFTGSDLGPAFSAAWLGGE